MKYVLQAILVSWLMVPPLFADDRPVVVELFTSQGCSSCPPADALLHELAKRDDVIALALHVDYWDYIGWKDEFADPRHAKRQRAYAIAAQRRSIYTPEMIVNGTTDIVGSKPMQLARAIDKHKNTPARVALSISRQGETVQIDARNLRSTTETMVVQVARYTPLREARITRGENAGHTLSYANVAHSWTVLGEWNGRAPLSMAAKVKGEEPVVVVIQIAGMGPIVAAAQLR
ncbi:thioredoxin family protein [uncultured Roseobacter sp.]|uniref:DUF1223 domain-containing protein n=1 Tax=uncultured Roseobacter sp. TaxID=114847 RepID=UPI00260FF9B7|nr:DUF1223 domain-containing protein [uncultured Roseobacter sp.]